MKSSGPPNYCVIGSPIAHSLSPYIMNKAFSDLDIDARYTAVEVPVNHLAGAMRELVAGGVRGANVTFPLKAAVLSHADRRSPAVEAIGAANTLVFTGDGIEAHNTDAAGSARALQVLGGVSPADRRVLIFGGGGAARAAAYGLLAAGAAGVTLAVRNTARTAAAVERLGAAFGGAPVEVCAIDDVDRSRHDIVVNATPVGMAGVDAAGRGALAASGIEPSQCYFDFVYNPINTEFLNAARSSGARTLDGLALLVAQAEASFHLWTGRHFSLPDMYAAVSAHAGDGPASSTETNP